MIDRRLRFGVQQFLDRGVVTLGDTRFELVLPAPKPARRIRWAINAMSPECVMVGSLALHVVSRGQTANAVRRLCLIGVIVMGVARERGCRRQG